LKERLIDYNKVVFSDVQRPNNEFSCPFAFLNHLLSNFDQFAFSDAQDEENEFAWPFDSLKYGFIAFSKVVF
jgi:hypothetical protein